LIIFITVLAIWIVSLCVHEYAHARVAYAGGDHTVAEKGYLSMNPLRYMNPLTSIVLPAVFLAAGFIALPGGAVWIESWRLRSRGWQSAVSVAGPASNLAVCILLGLPFLLGFDGKSTMWAIVAVSAYWQAIAFVLNMLPIPGLDGYGVVEPWLPAEVREWGRRFRPYGYFLLIILFIGSRTFQNVFGTLVGTILALLGVDGDMIGQGLQGMTFWRRG
jgi:Zn-dependent protease